MKKILLPMFLTVLCSLSMNAQIIDTLLSGTMVPISFTKMYCSNSTDQVTAFVSRDVLSPNGKILIRGGEVVKVEVEIKKAKSYGRPGLLRVSAVSTLTSDGSVVKLNGSELAEGENLKSSAWFQSCGAAILIPGLGILYGLFVHGGDACISNLPLVKTIETIAVKVR